MRLIDEQAVHTQLLECYHIVLAALGLQFLQPGFQGLLGAFQLLDRETLTAAVLHLGNALGDLVDLLLKEPFLTLSADGDFLKLAVSHDDGVIIAGGNAGAELLAVVGLKVLFGGDKNVGGRIEPQKLRRPLFGQMVRHHKEGFLTQAQALTLHGGSHHFKGFASAYLVCQQRIAAVQHMSDSVFLVFPQGDGRVHTTESNVSAVVFTGTGGVHFLIVLADQSLAAVRVFPNPVFESVPDRLLLLGGQGGLFGIQHPALFAVCILYGVIDTDIPQVQAVLQNLVGIGTAGSVGGIGCHIVLAYRAFAGDLPLSGERRIVDLDIALEIKRRVEGLIHKLLDVLFVDPGSAQAHLNLRRIQVFGLGSGKGLHIDCKGRVLLCRPLCLTQLAPHIAGQVFVGCYIMGSAVFLQLPRYTEDHAF